jgi:Sybindin-like family
MPSAYNASKHSPVIPPVFEVLIKGTKFLLITEPRQANVDAVRRRIYEVYLDYVMKNPFYQLEMPIR